MLSGTGGLANWKQQPTRILCLSYLVFSRWFTISSWLPLSSKRFIRCSPTWNGQKKEVIKHELRTDRPISRWQALLCVVQEEEIEFEIVMILTCREHKRFWYCCTERGDWFGGLCSTTYCLCCWQWRWASRSSLPSGRAEALLSREIISPTATAPTSQARAFASSFIP